MHTEIRTDTDKNKGVGIWHGQLSGRWSKNCADGLEHTFSVCISSVHIGLKIINQIIALYIIQKKKKRKHKKRVVVLINVHVESWPFRSYSRSASFHNACLFVRHLCKLTLLALNLFWGGPSEYYSHVCSGSVLHHHRSRWGNPLLT